MKISMVGTGYVGLVSGACFADKGFDVTCVDIDQKKIDMLRSGVIPIYEPGLKETVDNAVKREHLLFTTDVKAAIMKSRVIFICVGTPESEDGSPDLSAVFAVAKTIADTLDENKCADFKVVVTKSTVPVGTGDKIEEILRSKGLSSVHVVSNPEFLKEGAAISDFMHPDRVVIGAQDEKAGSLVADMYSSFTRKTDRIILMDRRSSEFTKYAANAMLALRITFMNQIANLCEVVGADVTNIRKGIGSDARIGPSFLYPGPGYGGSCFPKDIKALIDLGKKYDTHITIMESVDEFNKLQKFILAKKAISYFGDLTNKVVAVWGLAFKPNTDDIRESPSIYVIGELLKNGALVKAYDPEATENFRKIFDLTSITYCSSMYDAAKNADALIIITDWNEFKMPDFIKLNQLMKSPVIFDGRNIYSRKKIKDLGFTYFCIGRSKLH